MTTLFDRIEELHGAADKHYLTYHGKTYRIDDVNLPNRAAFRWWVDRMKEFVEVEEMIDTSAEAAVDKS